MAKQTFNFKQVGDAIDRVAGDRDGKLSIKDLFYVPARALQALVSAATAAFKKLFSKGSEGFVDAFKTTFSKSFPEALSTFLNVITDGLKGLFGKKE